MGKTLFLMFALSSLVGNVTENIYWFLLYFFIFLESLKFTFKVHFLFLTYM